MLVQQHHWVSFSDDVQCHLCTGIISKATRVNEVDGHSWCQAVNKVCATPKDKNKAVVLVQSRPKSLWAYLLDKHSCCSRPFGPSAMISISRKVGCENQVIVLLDPVKPNARVLQYDLSTIVQVQ